MNGADRSEEGVERSGGWTIGSNGSGSFRRGERVRDESATWQHASKQQNAFVRSAGRNC